MQLPQTQPQPTKLPSLLEMLLTAIVPILSQSISGTTKTATLGNPGGYIDPNRTTSPAGDPILTGPGVQLGDPTTGGVTSGLPGLGQVGGMLPGLDETGGVPGDEVMGALGATDADAFNPTQPSQMVPPLTPEEENLEKIMAKITSSLPGGTRHRRDGSGGRGRTRQQHRVRTRGH